MKKIKLIIMAVAALGLASSSAVYADSYAPGEGLYIGAFVGHSAGHVSAKVTADEVDGQATAISTSTVEIKDGGIALNGMDGGGWLGYGYKMGDLYVGFEMDGAGGGGKFEITSDKALATTNADTQALDLTKVSAEMEWNAGVAGSQKLDVPVFVCNSIPEYILQTWYSPNLYASFGENNYISYVSRNDNLSEILFKKLSDNSIDSYLLTFGDLVSPHSLRFVHTVQNKIFYSYYLVEGYCNKTIN